MLNQSNTLPNPKFCFGYCYRESPDLKITVYILAGTYYYCDHDVIGVKVLLTNPIKFGVSGKRILC